MTVAGNAAGRNIGGLVVLTESTSNGLVFVDPAKRANAVVDRIEVGAAPWAVAVHEGSRRAYVSTAEGLAVVDLERRERIALVPYLDQPDVVEYGEERPGGTGAVVTPDGASVYVAVARAGRTSTVELFDVGAGGFVRSLEVGLRPFDLQISPRGDEIYTIDHDSFTVHTIRLDGHEVLRAEVAPFGTDGGLMSHQKPHYAAVAADGRLFMPYQGRGLVIFDPSTQAYETEPMTGDTHQHGVGLTEDGRLLVVGVGAIGGATQGPSLTIRELAHGQELLVPLEKGHENVFEWVSTVDGRAKAVLTGGSTSRGPWDGLTVIDLETLEQYEVPVPGRPQMGALIAA
ncbi:YncE family protein [Agromyces sp. NPDC056965]|uniref:YncE family protein n=1 Tax=Agromyces sp. NPDC056965 TaxID=3345983 RepID=UPI00362DD1B4